MQSQTRRSGAEERKLGQKGGALDSLDVETDRGDRRYDLAKLQLVQNGGLASGVKTDLRGAEGQVSGVEEELAQRSENS